MIYLDTSYIVKCYVAEPGTEAVLEWIAGRRSLVCSLHGRIEFYSAIHRHVQAGQLTPVQARRVYRQFEEDETEGLWSWLPVTADRIRQACGVLVGLERKTCLRAADALHLATAADTGCECIYSHDRHLLAAAPLFGIPARDIID